MNRILLVLVLTLACGSVPTQIVATAQQLVTPQVTETAIIEPTLEVVEPRYGYVVGAWNCREGAGISNDVEQVISNVTVRIWLEAKAVDGSIWYFVEPYRCWIHSAATE